VDDSEIKKESPQCGCNPMQIGTYNLIFIPPVVDKIIWVYYWPKGRRAIVNFVFKWTVGVKRGHVTKGLRLMYICSTIFGFIDENWESNVVICSIQGETKTL
jgi:hypothetical protein